MVSSLKAIQSVATDQMLHLGHHALEIDAVPLADGHLEHNPWGPNGVNSYFVSVQRKIIQIVSASVNTSQRVKRGGHEAWKRH